MESQPYYPKRGCRFATPTCQSLVTNVCREWNSFVKFSLSENSSRDSGFTNHPVTARGQLASNSLLQFPDPQRGQQKGPCSCQRAHRRAALLRSRRERDFHMPSLRSVLREPAAGIGNREFIAVHIVRIHRGVVK